LSSEPVERRLAAILAADVAGYSRLIGADEEGTLAQLKAFRKTLVDPTIAKHRGRIVKTTGDGMLVEFASAVDAARCAVEIQRDMADENTEIPQFKRIEFRIGIHLGDIILDDNDIFGDGVNIAARLESIAVPGGISISRAVHDQVRDRINVCFDDKGEIALKNIARPLQVFAISGAKESKTTVSPESKPALALPDKPSIAVLPFQNMSGDPEQEYFADGMVEEIITALSRIRWLFVIARNSTFFYKGQSPDVKQVGRELGVRYVLEGSVRKGGGRVRITAQLIEAETNIHLWADRFDGSLEDVFDLQDKVAVNVAGVIEPTLVAAEITRATARPTKDLQAYDLYLKALPRLFQFSKEGLFEAAELFAQAITRDPQYGPALAFASVCHMRIAIDEWDEHSEPQAIELARRAIAVAHDDPVVLSNASFTLAILGDDITAMIDLADRAVSLNPSYARGWYLSGLLRLEAGQSDQAIELIEKALRLSPREGMGTPMMLSVIGRAQFYKKQFDLAAQNFMLCLRQSPGSPWRYRFLAASYAHQGRLQEANDVIRQLLALGVPVIPSKWLGNPNHPGNELLLSGLRLASGEGCLSGT